MADMDSLVVDTETSGKPIWDRRSSDPGQPYITELTWIFARAGDNRPVKSFSGLLRQPQLRVIPQDAAEVSKLSVEDLTVYGHDPMVVMTNMLNIVAAWPNKLAFVAHGAAFDKRVLRIQCERLDLRARYDELIEPLPVICTMHGTARIVNEAGGPGFEKWKTPKLSQSYAHFYGHPPPAAHDSLSDALAALACKAAMDRRGTAIAAKPAKGASRSAESAVEEIA